MNETTAGQSDSPGPDIPGRAGWPAWRLICPEPSRIPVLVAVPHAGRRYPEEVLRRLRHPEQAALRLEDRYVDRIAEDICEKTGAGLLVADAPRAMIDLNRAPDEIDWDMIARSGSMPSGQPRPGGQRARSGLGLIPRRLPGLGELWKGRFPPEELDALLSCVHEPYHRALADALVALRDRWGAGLLIDLHSMPPLSSGAGRPSAEFVIGDRFGASCDGRIVGTAFSHFARFGRLAAHNKPYAGHYVLDRHGAPAQGIHGFQLEIDRRCYLDSRLANPGDGFAALTEILAGLVARLGDEVAALGRTGSYEGSEGQGNWPQAAE